MSFDITRRRAADTAQVKLKNGDGAPLRDDEGNQLAVTVHGPGSKVWQAANAELNRKRAERLREGGGQIGAALGEEALRDQIEFLAQVTVSFDGWIYPLPKDKGEPGALAMFRAAYCDDGLGFIRDQVYGEVNNWAAFMQGSATS